MKEVILITGITGFLGCHLGQLIVSGNYRVVATRRSNSNLKNCLEFQEQVKWVNIEEDDWKEQIIDLKPTIVVHAAWLGVAASDRDDWELQSKNIAFLQNLLYIAQKSQTTKVIGLGSQAEYGFIETLVDESHSLKPVSAYGAVKVVCAHLMKAFCVEQKIHWYWLRVFAVFGEKEGEGWLIPKVIKTIAAKQTSSMPFSPGEQKYAYLYIRDLAIAVKKVLDYIPDQSGIYNMSADNPLPLKEIIIMIRDTMAPGFGLEFGALSYRQNQSMMIGGNMSLFKSVFGNLHTTTLEESIRNTIQFYS